MQLTRYDNDGLELAIDTKTGEVYASISAVARMIDKKQQTVSKYVNGGIKGYNQMTLLSAEVNTTGGLQGGTFLNENQILEVVAKYNPSLLIQFAKAGLRLGLQQLVGYQVTSELPDKAEFKLEGFDNIRQNCLNVSKQKGYNEVTGENAFNMAEGHMRDALNFNPDFTTALGATKAALVYAVATNRLHLEKDKSLQQNHQANMMYKAGRHAIGQTYGAESIPFESYPKVEQRLISSGTKPWIGNASSKVKAIKAA